MPRTTSRFPFEYKVLGWAFQLGQTIYGEDEEGMEALLVVHTDDGLVIHTGLPRSRLDVLRDEAEDSGHGWLLYDPFDLPVYSWLAWSGIPEDTGRRWARISGHPIHAGDYARNGEGPGRWPRAWSVMF